MSQENNVAVCHFLGKEGRREELRAPAFGRHPRKRRPSFERKRKRNWSGGTVFPHTNAGLRYWCLCCYCLLQDKRIDLNSVLLAICACLVHVMYNVNGCLDPSLTVTSYWNDIIIIITYCECSLYIVLLSQSVQPSVPWPWPDLTPFSWLKSSSLWKGMLWSSLEDSQRT